MAVQLKISNMIVVCNKLNKEDRQRLDALLQAGAKRKYVGSGACGVVYAFDEHRVFKIQSNDDSDYPSSRYFDWAAFCTKTRSKHVPKFDFVGRAFDGTVVTVLERLQAVDPLLANAADPVAEFLNSAHEDYSYSAVLSEVNLLNTEYDQRAVQKLRTVFPARRAKRLQKKVQTAGLYLNDMHDGNWMVRPISGELVITDPMC